MKTNLSIILLSLVLAAQISFAGDQPPVEADWLNNIEEAKSKAASENLPILISFSGSDWCLPCMRLDRDLFKTDDFLQYSREYLVLLKLDFPARKKNQLSEEQLKHNEALAEKYNTRGTFPLVVITDANGNLKGAMEHPQTSTSAYIKSIKTVVQQ